MDLLVLPSTTKASSTESRERSFSLLPHVDRIQMNYVPRSTSSVTKAHIVLVHEEGIDFLRKYLEENFKVQGGIIIAPTLSIGAFTKFKSSVPLLLLDSSESLKQLGKSHKISHAKNERDLAAFIKSLDSS